MTEDYRAGRQTVHLNMADDEFHTRMGAVANAFGSAWLQQGDHPLQALWQRKDCFAVNQLCLLGDAIAGLKPIDPRWVDDRIEKIKGSNINTRRGFMFKLLGVNLFRHSPQVIRPTKLSAPGYDAVLSLPDGGQVDFSLKGFGTSSHEEAFRKQAASTEQAFTNTMKARQFKGAVLMAIANAYPAASDWGSLRAALPVLPHGQAAPAGIWAVKIAALPLEFGPYSDHHFSYQVFMSGPFHANESKNLFDKFDDAAINARKHAATKKDNVRVVLLRVPETISLLSCTRWTQEYIANNPGGPIDGVYLYQLTVVDQPDGSSVMSHAFSFTETPNFQTWRSPPGRPRRVLAMNIAVGVPTKPTRRQIIGGPANLQFEDGYFYQKGDFYTLQIVDPKKPTNAIVKNLASGIFQHAVFQFRDGHFTIGGHFPPLKEITLFD